MWLKCVGHPKNAIFTQNFAMSATPEVRSYMYLLSSRCKLDPTCMSCPADNNLIQHVSVVWQVSVVQLMQVRSGMYELSD